MDIRVISEETGFYYLESRYYDPNTGRFINADGQLNNGLLGNNMYAYCENNPVMYVDPMGRDINWGTVLDFAVTFLAFEAGVATGATVGLLATGITWIVTGDVNITLLVGAGTAAAGGILGFGIVNNSVNAIYYEFAPEDASLETNPLESSYVSMGYINRWDRLRLTKYKTGDKHYFLNAWRYYSEYSAHMYAWFATSWAYGKDYGSISKIAERSYQAWVEPHAWDRNSDIVLLTKIFMLLGI